MSVPALSVIIPCRDVATTLGAQLEALASQTGDVPFEVVVVDNGSSDGTAEVARRFANRLDLRVVGEEVPGINAARNAGVRAARSDHLAFCDGDDVVVPGWVEAMAKALESHRYVAGAIDVETLNGLDLAASRGFPRGGPPSFAGVFSFAPGGNMGVHRGLLDEVGGLNEDTEALDDQELGLRMHLVGERPYFASDAVVRYRYRDGIGSLWRQGVTYGRGRVAVLCEVRQAGLPTPFRLGGWRSWVWLPANLWRLRTRPGRSVWVWVLANRCGHLVGSIRYRQLYL